MRKIIPLLKIVAILSAVGWCIQNYSKNGFRDLTDFIIPLILILYFLYDFYSSRKKKLEKLLIYFVIPSLLALLYFNILITDWIGEI